MSISTFQRFARTSDTRPKTTSPISGKYCERSGLAVISLFTSASGPQTLEVTSSLNDTWKPCPNRDPFPRCAARLLSPGATKLAPGEGMRTEKKTARKNRVVGWKSSWIRAKAYRSPPETRYEREKDAASLPPSLTVTNIQFCIRNSICCRETRNVRLFLVTVSADYYPDHFVLFVLLDFLTGALDKFLTACLSTNPSFLRNFVLSSQVVWNEGTNEGIHV